MKAFFYLIFFKEKNMYIFINEQRKREREFFLRKKKNEIYKLEVQKRKPLPF